MKFRLQNINTADKVILLTTLFFGITQGLVYFEVVAQRTLNEWFCVPQQFSLFLERPWTLLTYAFYHVNMQHLFWNMLFLFFSGHIFFHLFKTKVFLITYIFNTLGGGIAFLLFGYLAPTIGNNTALLGASAAVIGLLFFVVSIFPSYKIYIFTFRIQLLYFLLALLLFDCIDITNNIGGKIAHLGGVLSGILVGLICKYQRNSKSFSSTSSLLRGTSSLLNEEERVKQHQIRRLFNKISTSGYDSLTDEEKKFLFKASKEEN